jgi:hypothetical protein
MSTNSYFRLFKKASLLLTIVFAVALANSRGQDIVASYDYVCAGDTIFLTVKTPAWLYNSEPGRLIHIVDPYDYSEISGSPQNLSEPVNDWCVNYFYISYGIAEDYHADRWAAISDVGDDDPGNWVDEGILGFDWIHLQVTPSSAHAYVACTTSYPSTVTFSLENSFAGDDGVTWSISPTVTGGATINSSSGVVTVGTAINTYTITATSVDDSSCPATASLTTQALSIPMSIKTYGSLSGDDYLGANTDVQAILGTGFSLGGPIITLIGTLGHIVELKGTVPSGISPADCSLSQTLSWTITIKFSDNSQVGPTTGDTGPDGPAIYQNNSGQVIYEIDAPGLDASTLFSYFGSSPPSIAGQPSGTTVSTLTVHANLVTTAYYHSCAVGSISWYTQYVITGAGIGSVTSSAGTQ